MLLIVNGCENLWIYWFVISRDLFTKCAKIFMKIRLNFHYINSSKAALKLNRIYKFPGIGLFIIFLVEQNFTVGIIIIIIINNIFIKRSHGCWHTEVLLGWKLKRIEKYFVLNFSLWYEISRAFGRCFVLDGVFLEKVFACCGSLFYYK